jgi:hypothetical protein
MTVPVESPGDLKPPRGGQPPPRDSAPLAGGPPVNLRGLAIETCRRYALEFPDEMERYGPAGQVWCVHDNQHLLSWAVDAVNDGGDMRDDVGWLASVLQAREFPLDRLARGMGIAADVAVEALPVGGGQVAGVLRDAEGFVNSHGDFSAWFVG